MDGFGDGPEEFEALERPVIQGIAGCVKAKALQDGLLSVNGAVIGKFGDDELRGEAEGGHASGEWTGGCGRDQRGLVTVVLTAELWSNEAPLDKAGGFVIEELGDFLSDEFELVFVLLVSFGKEGLLNDFELIPAFESAVIFTLGLFVYGSCFVCPLRFWVAVSRGGVGLFRLKTFNHK